MGSAWSRMIIWTQEELAKRGIAEVRALRENALRLDKRDVVELCDADLLRRKPLKSSKPPADRESRVGFYVSEFHFVCPDELGVFRNADGTRATGIWVVAVDNAEAAQKYGSIVALHSTRNEPSYIQGTIVGWQTKEREKRYSGEQLNKTRLGVEFTFQPTDTRLPWQGAATGEKGYAWAPIPG